MEQGKATPLPALCNPQASIQRVSTLCFSCLSIRAISFRHRGIHYFSHTGSEDTGAKSFLMLIPLKNTKYVMVCSLPGQISCLADAKWHLLTGRFSGAMESWYILACRSHHEANWHPFMLQAHGSFLSLLVLCVFLYLLPPGRETLSAK